MHHLPVDFGLGQDSQNRTYSCRTCCCSREGAIGVWESRDEKNTPTCYGAQKQTKTLDASR